MTLADEYRKVIEILDREISDVMKKDVGYAEGVVLERLMQIRGEYRDMVIDSMCKERDE